MQCRHRIDSNPGDVPNIDESGSAGAGWREEAVIVNDIVSVGIALILSKETWSDNGPSLWSKPKVLLEGRAGVGHSGRTKQEDGIAASHSPAESARFEEIERDHLDVVQRTNQVRLPCADAKPDVTGAEATEPLTQRFHYSPSQVPL